MFKIQKGLVVNVRFPFSCISSHFSKYWFCFVFLNVFPVSTNYRAMMDLNKQRQFIKIYFKSSPILLQKDNMIHFFFVCFMGKTKLLFLFSRLKVTNACGGRRWSPCPRTPKFIMKCHRVICPLGHQVASVILISLLGRSCFSPGQSDILAAPDFVLHVG